jgi:hypothetical protein
MRRSLSVATLGSIAVALTIGLSATASQAATAMTWTVTPGGAITGSAGTTTLKDTTASLTVTCTSSTATGMLKPGTGLKGAGIGTVTSLAFNSCSVDGITLSISTGTVAYPLNAKSFSAGVAGGSVTKIHFSVSSSVCSFTVDGTSGTADNGSVRTRYANSSQVLRIIPKHSTLHIYNVSGCFGLVNNGDAATVSTSYKVTPGQTITSP